MDDWTTRLIIIQDQATDRFTMKRLHTILYPISSKYFRARCWANLFIQLTTSIVTYHNEQE